MVIFAVWLSFDCFWLFLTIGTLLVHCWYSLGRHVTIGTPMVIFAVLSVFWLFLTVLDCFWLFLTIGIGTLYQSSKTVKTIGVSIVTGLLILYQQCTNCQKQSKNSQNSKNDYWCTNRHMSTKTTVYQIVKNSQNSQDDNWCTNRHMSTQSQADTQSPRPRPRPPSSSASAEYTKPDQQRFTI